MILLALAAAALDPVDTAISKCYSDRSCAAHAIAHDKMVSIAIDYCKDMGPRPTNLTLEQQMDLINFCYVYWSGWWDNSKQALDKHD